MLTNIACWSKDITTGDITSHTSLRDFNRKLGRRPSTVVDRKTYYPGKNIPVQTVHLNYGYPTHM